MTMLQSQQIRDQRDNLAVVRKRAARFRDIGLVVTADVLDGAANRWESFLERVETEYRREEQ